MFIHDCFILFFEQITGIHHQSAHILGHRQMDKQSERERERVNNHQVNIVQLHFVNTNHNIHVYFVFIFNIKQ